MPDQLVHWMHDAPPEPPYYATVFSSVKRDPRPGYDAMDEATMRAVTELDGYLGHQVVHQGDRSLFIAYWRDLEAIDTWREHTLHRMAKEKGRSDWYQRYRFEICRVEQAAEFERPE